MKKTFAVLTVLIMCLCLAVSFAEETGEKTDGTAAVPNPVVEYASLEEINALTGVALMRPSAASVENESFSVIGDKIAQYVCEIDGLEWTFRGAYATEEDISGIYDEYNEFTPREDLILYTNAYYLDRFFDGDRQYTIVVKDPVGGDGEVWMDEEVFMDICAELESVQKQHTDDPLVGDYRDTENEETAVYVERIGDVYNISVNRSDPDLVWICITVCGAVRDGDTLSYRGEEAGRFTYDEEGNETSADVTVSEAPGFFEVKDGMLHWTGALREEWRSRVFEKIAYEE